MTVSLTDLKTKRAAMTQGEFQWDDRKDLIRVVGGDSVFDGAPVGHCNSSLMCSADDATGIVATHNAADCLIAAVEAADAYRNAERYAATVRASQERGFAYQLDPAIPDAEGHLEQCRDRLDAALAKVLP